MPGSYSSAHQRDEQLEGTSLRLWTRPGPQDFSDRARFLETRRNHSEFVLDENKVRFEVNLTNAEKAGLTLSSDLPQSASRSKRRITSTRSLTDNEGKRKGSISQRLTWMNMLVSGIAFSLACSAF